MVKQGNFFRHYKTKNALMKDIKNFIDSYPLNQEFESDLISDLIAEKHYYCSCHGLRPIRFRKEFRPGSYNFFGFFPSLEWHKISWKQCIFPDSKESIVKEALRKAIQPHISEHKRLYPFCEKCGEPSQEIDHVDPEFDVIAQQALKTLSDKDWESIMIDSFNFLIKEDFRLPDNNSALIYTLEAHKTAKLQAVCKKCHCANARERKKKE
jgi:hypothetical protein